MRTINKSFDLTLFDAGMHQSDLISISKKTKFSYPLTAARVYSDLKLLSHGVDLKETGRKLFQELFFAKVFKEIDDNLSRGKTFKFGLCEGHEVDFVVQWNLIVDNRSLKAWEDFPKFCEVWADHLYYNLCGSMEDDVGITSAIVYGINCCLAGDFKPGIRKAFWCVKTGRSFVVGLDQWKPTLFRVIENSGESYLLPVSK